MSVKADATEQVRFLVHCIGHAQNGRPDFNAVATEMGIVSKAAAQKRYERLLKQYNITKKPNQASAAADGDSESTPKKGSPKKRGAPGGAGGAKGSPIKKRAGRGVKKEESDEEEDKPPKAKPARAAASKKSEAASEDSSEEKPVKGEREESPLSDPPTDHE